MPRSKVIALKVPENALKWLRMQSYAPKCRPALRIFSVLSGIPLEMYNTGPATPDDLIRIVKLITAVPEWKLRLYEIKDLSVDWNRFFNYYAIIQIAVEKDLNGRNGSLCIDPKETKLVMKKFSMK